MIRSLFTLLFCLPYMFAFSSTFLESESRSGESLVSPQITDIRIALSNNPTIHPQLHSGPGINTSDFQDPLTSEKPESSGTEEKTTEKREKKPKHQRTKKVKLKFKRKKHKKAKSYHSGSPVQVSKLPRVQRFADKISSRLPDWMKPKQGKQTKGGRMMGLLSFLCGILGILLFFANPFVGLGLSALAIVFGILGLVRRGGVFLSIMGIILGFILLVPIALIVYLVERNG